MIRILISILFFLISTVCVGQRDSSSSLDTSFFRVSGNLDSTDLKIPYPLNPVGWTSDFEHLLTNEQIHFLDSIIQDFNVRTSIEIAIVSIDSSYISSDKFDNFVTTLGNIWGVGSKEKDNGIIVGISAGLKKIRISYGSGIMRKMSNSDTQKIIDNFIIPNFKQALYFEGLAQNLTEIIKKIK